MNLYYSYPQSPIIQGRTSNLTPERKSQLKSYNMPNCQTNEADKEKVHILHEDFSSTSPSAFSILEKVKDTFENCEIGTVFSRQEIIDKVVLNYGCNPSSIIPSDYCYNRLNNEIDFSNYLHIFEYLNRSSNKYLGESYKIYHKPKNGNEIVVGQWVNGNVKLI